MRRAPQLGQKPRFLQLKARPDARHDRRRSVVNRGQTTVFRATCNNRGLSPMDIVSASTAQGLDRTLRVPLLSPSGIGVPLPDPIAHNCRNTGGFTTAHIDYLTTGNP